MTQCVLKTAVILIRENKIQAQRDLDSARILLESSDPHLENVAFLLEQSFEKIVKASYTGYKLETDSASWEEVYKNIRGHDIDFILTILVDIYENCAKTLAQIPETFFDYVGTHDILSKETEKILRSSENLIYPIKLIQSLKNEITWARENFVKFLSKLDSENITEPVIEPSDIPQISITMKNLPNSETDFNMHNQRFLYEHIIFLTHLIITSCVISHAIYSRYPAKEHDMCNLEAYRDNPKLEEFFNALADRIQKMLDTEAGFTRLLIKISSISSNMPHQIKS